MIWGVTVMRKRIFVMIISVIMVMALALTTASCNVQQTAKAEPDAAATAAESTGSISRPLSLTAPAVTRNQDDAEDKVSDRAALAEKKGTGEATETVREEISEETPQETASTAEETSAETLSNKNTGSVKSTLQNQSRSVISSQTKEQIKSQPQQSVPNKVQEQIPQEEEAQEQSYEEQETVSSADDGNSDYDYDTGYDSGFTGLSSYQQNLLINRIVADVNALRGSSLYSDGTLISYASTRAAEASYCWSHTRPNGSRGCDMISSDKWRGENLAKVCISSGFTGSDDQLYALADRIVNDWVNSSSHYANLVSENFAYIGVYTYASVSGESVTFTTAAMFSN